MASPGSGFTAVPRTVLRCHTGDGALSGAASPGGVLQAGDPRVPLVVSVTTGCHTPSSWPGLSRGDLSLSHSPPWLP